MAFARLWRQVDRSWKGYSSNICYAKSSGPSSDHDIALAGTAPSGWRWRQRRRSRRQAAARDLQFEGPAWNGSTVDLIRLAKAHGYLVLVQTFFTHVDGLRQKVEPLGRPTNAEVYCTAEATATRNGSSE